MIIRHDRDAVRDSPAINPSDLNSVLKPFCPDADVSLVIGFSHCPDLDVVTAAALDGVTDRSADEDIVFPPAKNPAL